MLVQNPSHKQFFICCSQLLEMIFYFHSWLDWYKIFTCNARTAVRKSVEFCCNWFVAKRISVKRNCFETVQSVKNPWWNGPLGYCADAVFELSCKNFQWLMRSIKRVNSRVHFLCIFARSNERRCCSFIAFSHILKRHCSQTFLFCIKKIFPSVLFGT